jgi:hypothetical protein
MRLVEAFGAMLTGTRLVPAGKQPTGKEICQGTTIGAI